MELGTLKEAQALTPEYIMMVMNLGRSSSHRIFFLKDYP